MVFSSSLSFLLKGSHHSIRFTKLTHMLDRLNHDNPSINGHEYLKSQTQLALYHSFIPHPCHSILLLVLHKIENQIRTLLSTIKKKEERKKERKFYTTLCFSPHEFLNLKQPLRFLSIYHYAISPPPISIRTTTTTTPPPHPPPPSTPCWNTNAHSHFPYCTCSLALSQNHAQPYSSNYKISKSPPPPPMPLLLLLSPPQCNFLILTIQPPRTRRIWISLQSYTS
jgi:hypothetical protein